MNLTLTLAGFIMFAYLIGSLSSAILICKLMGLGDPRTQGSHNPGATNVLRIGGKKAAFFTLLGDGLKGFIPVFIAKKFGLEIAYLAMVAMAAFIGHLYPLFFKFKGGKGVATALGALLGLSFLLGSISALTWVLVALIFRYSSLAALVFAGTAPLYTWLLIHSKETLLIISLMMMLLIYRHRKNIRHLWIGTEDKIGKKKVIMPKAANEHKF